MTRAFLLILAFSVLLPAQGTFPSKDEVLQYTVKLPTGTAIGNATFEATRVKGAPATWQFRVQTNFSLPGIPVEDSFRALSGNFCTAEFEKDSLHGSKKTGEMLVFHQGERKAIRTTKGGGVSEVAIGPCAKDPVTVLYFTRMEMSKGRKPFTGTTVFGASYDVKMEQKGKEKIKLDGTEHQADRLAGTFKGPKSKGEFEIFLARDDARTPLMLRVPLALGTITLELKP